MAAAPFATATKIPPQSGHRRLLSAGGEMGKYYDEKSGSEKEIVNRQRANSDSDGNFAIKGVYAIPGDTVSIPLYNGDLEQAYYIGLDIAGDAATEMEFTVPVYNPATKKTEPTAVTETGHLFSLGILEFPQRTPYTPLIEDIQYKFKLSTSYIYADPTKNQIPILNDTIVFTAMVNPNGRRIKAVEFVTRKKTGAVLAERVEPQSQSDTRMTFTMSQKMDTYFDSGDRLYMRVIDEEERAVIFDGVETSMDMVYPEVYTGLSFYVPTIEVIPQSYTFEQADSINVPVFGDMAIKANTGRLSFQYQQYGDYQNAPYALQAFFPLSLNTQLKTPAGVIQEVWAGKTGKAPDTEKQMEDAQAKGTPQGAIDAVDGTVKDTTAKPGAAPEAIRADANKAAAPKSSSSFFKKMPLSISFLLALEFDFF